MPLNQKTPLTRPNTVPFDFDDPPALDMVPNYERMDVARVDGLYRWAWIGAGCWMCVLILLVVVFGVV